MELTYGILHDLLKGELPLPPAPARNSRNIQKILPWTGENAGGEYLYLVLEPTADPPENGLEIGPWSPVGWGLSVEKEQVLPSVSRICWVLQEFQAWQSQCTILAEAEHDLPGLLKLGTRLMGFGLVLVDRDYHLESSPELCPSLPNTPWETVMPPHAVEELYSQNPEFDQTFHRRGLHPYPQYPTPGYRFYYYNLHQESFYLGRLLIYIPEEVFGPGSLQTAAFLGSLAESCYQYQYLRRNRRENDRMLLLCRQLLAGQEVDREELVNQLRARGWAPTHRYRVLHLVSNGYFHSDQTLKYYAKQLEALFPACIALQMEGGLYCLQNLDRESDPDFRQSFSGFLRENLFRAGISNSYTDIFDSPRYRRQAQTALKLGQEKAPALWRYDFSDFVGEYVLTKCLEEYPAQDLCPGNLRTLLEYDREHPEGDLLNTLRQYYFCQFNAQLAASKLFIHRTTFFYRMNKIQKIAPFHPENPEETAQILLAFQALEKE